MSEEVATVTFFDIPATDIQGMQHANLNAEAGDFATLLVNVASNCALTEEQYRELVQLQDEYGADGFSIIAVPSNDFDQEPEENATILANMKAKHGINFPMLSKSHVNGEETHELYKYVKALNPNNP